ncbi:hypothetical protein CDD82_5050 [Ophiocordyceps australis]|uniref:beta-N-acetylhexosaminidase n=1 Tax=Ophiocordyceps australis TaxID=1399860 RepID=A0A2C5Z4R6_9HYPO|nr:hypothetical protein CDD82_5050 [Ophiocordyceps australis]
MWQARLFTVVGVVAHSFIFGAAEARLGTIPSTPFTARDGTYSLDQLKSIIYDKRYAQAVDDKGQTLIPETLEQFAHTFQQDVAASLGIAVPVVAGEGDEAVAHSIFMTLDAEADFLDAAGRPTAEGYRLVVNELGITIAGASPLGVWWGTRTLLQAAVLGNNSMAHGQGVDAPGWAIRGLMIDGGRKFYPAGFVAEMCAYLSFFKQNTLQLHLSDNLNNYPDRYSEERTLSLYSAFRLWSQDAAVAGLAQLRNESYSRTEFDWMQSQCAKRGVTLVPEIEAPGHALAIVKWRRRIALETDLSMLNISHPDTLPTLESIWSVFLPWFQCKTVHIGADEYDGRLVAQYSRLVNSMAAFIKQQSGKATRIWGTFTPNQGANVSRDVVMQHWSRRMDDALHDYIDNGYQVVNADNAFYVVGKWSPAYPPRLKKTLVFSGNPATSGSFSPNILDTSDASRNAPRDSPSIQGHLAALWNDWGPNGTTVLEAYHSVRDALPALGDKQWGGDLTEHEYDSVIDVLRDAAPGQNLDRRIKSLTNVLVEYRFANITEDGLIVDTSGNGYHGRLQGKGCTLTTSASLYLSGMCQMATPLSSKGRDYILSFSIKPFQPRRISTLFMGPDSALVANQDGSLAMLSDGHYYQLDPSYTLPINRWTTVSLIARDDQTVVKVSIDGHAPRYMKFSTQLGIWGLKLRGAPMAFEAPLATIGLGFVGLIKDISLRVHA